MNDENGNNSISQIPKARNDGGNVPTPGYRPPTPPPRKSNTENSK